MQCAVAQGWIKEDYQLFGHRQAKDTLCPGDMLYEAIQSWPHWVCSRSITQPRTLT